MNLREFIQSEIKSQLYLSEASGTLKFESVNEGIWPKSKLSNRFQFILADELKTKFKGIFYVVGYDLYHNDKMIMRINPDNDSVNSIVNHISRNKSITKIKESVNEAPSRRSTDFFEDSKHGIAIQKLLKGKWDSKKVEAFLDKLGDGNDVKHARILDFIAGSLGMNIRKYKTLGDMMPELIKTIEQLYKTHNESINESEQLDEKLITFSNRAPYGQIVFMAGGAGSGKGFAIDNFIDAAGFKVRDVDEMKKAVANLNRLGKFSVDTWYKKYGNKLSTKPPKNNPDGMSEKQHIEEFFLGKGYSIADIANPKHKSGGLKNPNNVAALHYIVDVMDLKDKWIINMLKGKENKETLPNLLFDITAKKVSSITEVIKPLIDAGYDSKNIHLIWVLTNYDLSIVQNKKRDRVVPDDILLQTHEGAAKTMWGILTQIKPKGLDGRIDVILNNREETVPVKDSNGNVIKVKQTNISGKQLKNTDKFSSDYGKNIDAKIVVKGFKSLPIKKQGGGIVPEEVWKDILFKWIKDNAPKTIDLSQTVGE